MTDDKHQLDEQIARYRAAIVSEVELARSDLDEIEDHLRALVAELRERGMPLAEAVALASQRLGEPCQLAREHARVRSPYGSKLSRARAWSATALLALPIAYYGHNDLRYGLLTIASLHLVIWMGLVGALGARRTWARALVVGMLATSLFNRTVHVAAALLVARANGYAENFGPSVLAMLALTAAAFAFVAPWRSGELGRRGVALALLGPAYLGGLGPLMFYIKAPYSVVTTTPIGSFAFGAALVAIGGVLRGARWAGIASAVAGCALGVLACTALIGGDYRIVGRENIGGLHIGSVALLGALGALAASIALWRGRLGTVRNAIG